MYFDNKTNDTPYNVKKLNLTTIKLNLVKRIIYKPLEDKTDDVFNPILSPKKYYIAK